MISIKKAAIGAVAVASFVIPMTSPAGAAVAKQTGKNAASTPTSMAYYCQTHSYCFGNEPTDISGKVNLIQPEANKVILAIGISGLAPNKTYYVYADSNGGCWDTGSPVDLGTFTTDDYGNGDFNYTNPAMAPGSYTWALNINDSAYGHTVAAAGTCYGTQDVTFTVPAV